MVPPGKILPSHRLKNLTVAPVYTWLFVHPGRQRGQPDHRNDHPGDHVGHLRVERVLPWDVFLPGCHQEHLAQAQLGLCLFEAGAWTSDCHKVGLDTRSPLWCRVRIRKVIIAICFAPWDFQVASQGTSPQIYTVINLRMKLLNFPFLLFFHMNLTCN